MSKTLFEIGEDGEALDDLLTELEGDISDPKIAEAIDGWLSEIQDARSEKFERYAALIRKRRASAQWRREESVRIEALAVTDDKIADQLETRLIEFMVRTNLKKVETPRYKIWWQNNGGSAPLKTTNGLRPDGVPENYQKTVTKTTTDFDNKAIRAALESGMKLGWAWLGERGRSLQIK